MYGVRTTPAKATTLSCRRAYLSDEASGRERLLRSSRMCRAHELQGLAFRPGVVTILKLDSVLDGRMGVKPEDDERVRIGIGKVDGSERLVGLRRAGIGIR